MGSTAVYTGHETDPAAAQHVFTQAKKQGEEALVKLHARISAVLEAKDTQKQQGKQQGKQQEKQQEKQDEMAQGVGGSGGGVEGNGVVHASADEGVQAEGQDGGGAAAAVGTSMHGEKQGGADVADADMLVYVVVYAGHVRVMHIHIVDTNHTPCSLYRTVSVPP